MRVLTAARIYRDSQGPADEGWAYRLTYSDGHQESSALEDTIALADPDDEGLAVALSELVHDHGGRVGTITVLDHDGGSAEWEATGR